MLIRKGEYLSSHISELLWPGIRFSTLKNLDGRREEECVQSTLSLSCSSLKYAVTPKELRNAPAAKSSLFRILSRSRQETPFTVCLLVLSDRDQDFNCSSSASLMVRKVSMSERLLKMSDGAP